MAGSNAAPDEDRQLVIDRLRADLAALRQSRRRLVEGEAADRRALERALHDGVQQRLVALAVDVQLLARLLDREPAAATAQLEEMAANIREAMAETSALAAMISPLLLDRRGLASSLRSAAANAGVTVLVDVPAGVDYPPEVGAAVYWTFVTALADAAPRSQATMRMHDADGGVTFEVVVAGRHPAALLDRLRDRIEALDGRLTVDEEDLASRMQGWLPLSASPGRSRPGRG
jgi:signal transduction histidine kinase